MVAAPEHCPTGFMCGYIGLGQCGCVEGILPFAYIVKHQYEWR
jgi:hypothetical protein